MERNSRWLWLSFFLYWTIFPPAAEAAVAAATANTIRSVHNFLPHQKCFLTCRGSLDAARSLYMLSTRNDFLKTQWPEIGSDYASSDSWCTRGTLAGASSLPRHCFNWINVFYCSCGHKTTKENLNIEREREIIKGIKETLVLDSVQG